MPDDNTSATEQTPAAADAPTETTTETTKTPAAELMSDPASQPSSHDALYDRVNRLAGVRQQPAYQAQPTNASADTDTKAADEGGSVSLTPEQQARIDKVRDASGEEAADALQDAMLQTAKAQREIAELRKGHQESDRRFKQMAEIENQRAEERTHGILDKIAKDNGYAAMIGVGNGRTPAHNATRSAIIGQAIQLRQQSIEASPYTGEQPLTAEEALLGAAYIVTRQKASTPKASARDSSRTIPPSSGGERQPFKSTAEARDDARAKARAYLASSRL